MKFTQHDMPSKMVTLAQTSVGSKGIPESRYLNH